MKEIHEALFTLQDTNYKAFCCRLIPTVDPDTVLGIRIPALRRYSRSLNESQVQSFLAELPHRYYEENNLHGILISQMNTYEETITALESFLPYVDNWSTCDLIRPRSFQKKKAGLPEQIQCWLTSAQPYTVRFGIEILMVYFLRSEFRKEFPLWVAQVYAEEYYVRMMAAWYFAEALAVRYEEIVPYLKENRLDPWVHNKTISKACESYRILPEQKTELRLLRRK